MTLYRLESERFGEAVEVATEAEMQQVEDALWDAFGADLTNPGNPHGMDEAAFRASVKKAWVEVAHGDISTTDGAAAVMQAYLAARPGRDWVPVVEAATAAGVWMPSNRGHLGAWELEARGLAEVKWEDGRLMVRLLG
jgi:hypothetical protein